MSVATLTEASADLSLRLHPSKLSVVAAVTRRLVPYLIEATLIPTLLFYAFLITLDLRWESSPPWGGATPPSPDAWSAGGRFLACSCSAVSASPYGR
jgi:hypothetical protein